VAVAGSAFAISFGVLARAAGMGSFAPIAMSATTFGGSAQFAAVSVLHDGGGAVTAIVASVLLNLRYLPIGVSVASGFTGGLVRRLVESRRLPRRLETQLSAIWLTVLVVGAVTVAIKAIGPVVLARRELPRRLLDVVELLATSAARSARRHGGGRGQEALRLRREVARPRCGPSSRSGSVHRFSRRSSRRRWWPR
jgi:hypothetical protein